MTKKNNPLIKPYLKWAGGKRQLLPEIKKYIPSKFDTYYEPFVGAGALLFYLLPKKAVINDINDQLILTYKSIKNNLDELIYQLNIYAANNSEDFFYSIRDLDRNPVEFNQLPDFQKAARFIYLNKTCYNGLYRVNSQGLFNVPFGKYKNPAICEETVLRAINKYFNQNNIEFLNNDFCDVISQANEHSFVYLDPPYHSPDNTNFTGYQANKFDEQEQTRLKKTFEQLTLKKSKCLLSNSDTEFIRELYKEFKIETISANRAINADAAGRGKVNEVLIRNW